MLRDVLTSLPGFATWPCDEINYIWRHGNVRYPSDEFTPDMARAEVCGYIRRRFDRVAQRYRAKVVVEKTCANSLRVGFVNAVLPDAKFVLIFRDGRDAVASAMKRWVAPLDFEYIFKKARYVPFGDMPYYAFKYLRSRIAMTSSRKRRISLLGATF